MKLKKDHNPSTNKQLLYHSQLTFSDLPKAVAEAMQLFHVKRILPAIELSRHKRFSLNWKKILLRPFLEDRSYRQPSTSYYIGMDGIPYPIWKKVLDQEEVKLETNGLSEVNVADYGAIGDGQTDNTEAFKKAIGKGKVKVTIPPGVFLVRGIKLPSWTILAGEGKGNTILKLHHHAPKWSRIITNTHHRKGNHHIKVADLTLDWNVERLNHKSRTSSGNNLSSCLTYANVTYGWIKRVEALNPGLHCFDVSSTFYTYAGDSTWAKGASKYIWFDELTGYGFGDDGITTHHSEHILISNSHMAHPSGRAHKSGFSNSNGFEIDDGSYGVWLLHNSSTHCYSGIEVKAHQTAAAAASTVIIGHLSVRDTRSFNFRHIGHHLAKDEASQTAYDIIAINLQSIMPVRTTLYRNSSPRALVVSAYQNVVIHTFTALGDRHYDYHGQPAIAVQYRARNVHLHHLAIKHFRSASTDVQIFGGPQHVDDVFMENIQSEDSAPTAVKIGENVKNSTIRNVHGEVVH